MAVLGSMELSEAAKEAAQSSSIAKKYKKNKKGAAPMPFSEQTHTDAVMTLSLNPF